jgi:Cof subfamily protein (haloacid dehalogenase superfamily)
MDGTLLNSKHELNPRFYTIFHQLRQRGIIFAAASGRQYYNIRNVFNDIKEDMYFIAENGGVVMHRETDLYVQPMDAELTMNLIADAKKMNNTFTILCGKRKAYIEEMAPFFLDHLKMYYDEYEIVPDLLQVRDDDFLKIAICDMSGAEANSYPLFREKGRELQVKVSGNVWLDISHRLANKGSALNVLQQHLGVHPDETMVFGDYLNDLEMMEQAGFSYAMENAHPEVKAVAKYSAATNDQDGVLQILDRVLA